MLAMEDNIRPPFSLDDARDIAAERYGIQTTSIHSLPSELDRNFRLCSADGSQFVLKIAHSSVSPSVLDLQNKTLRHLSATLEFFPRLIPQGTAATPSSSPRPMENAIKRAC